MAKKVRRKIAIKSGVLTRGFIVKVRFAVVILAVIVGAKMESASALSCGDDVEVIFVRGSGAPLNESGDYLAFKTELEKRMTKLSGFNTGELSYAVRDLEYPAQGIGMDNIMALIGAYFGAGDAYEFGKSVDKGVEMLVDEISRDGCGTKYVISGYSQGAMVVSKAIHSINPNKIIYAATIGDPKIYLPEGEGIFPPACKNENLSDYRVYVPDCRAREGLLGSYRPYEPFGYAGKLGTWCNKYDVFCSSFLGISSHVAYEKDGIYKNIATTIVNKIADEFDLSARYVTEHDTAILIDTTYSMNEMIDRYKVEALRLARETLENGGRVALYDYRDLKVGYQPRQWCDFETCDLETFEAQLNNLTTEARRNGDEAESLLAAADTVMRELKWKTGATKSLVILTDASYLDPDRNMTTFEQVVKLSRQIDPVNIYVVTESWMREIYAPLTHETGGRVAVLGEDEVSLTNYIMARYDALPQVEDETDTATPPSVEVTRVVEARDEILVEFEATGGRAIVALNDAVLGVSDSGFVAISELDRTRENIVRLVAIDETRRGRAAEVIVGAEKQNAATTEEHGVATPKGQDAVVPEGQNVVMPKAPNTGKL